jgi:hypothetical protein
MEAPMPPARRLDDEIDRLYKLAPDEFTPARNALAKTAGADGPAIKQLTKPPLAAWAVNQVHWHQPDVYNALVSAAKTLRQTHKAILSGRTGDVRAAGKVHEAAVDAALKAALSQLASNGHPATDSTRQAIATTLRALPGNEPPGRLTRTLQPGGFEMLAGLSIGAEGLPADAHKTVSAATAPARIEKLAPSSGKARRKEPEATPKPDPKALARAREAAAKAARELREAEHTARREEFEAARATREAEKAARQLEQAREALAAAEKDVETAEAAATEAERTRAAAEKRAEAAERALDAARKRSKE